MVDFPASSLHKCQVRSRGNAPKAIERWLASVPSLGPWGWGSFRSTGSGGGDSCGHGCGMFWIESMIPTFWKSMVQRPTHRILLLSGSGGFWRKSTWRSPHPEFSACAVSLPRRHVPYATLGYQVRSSVVFLGSGPFYLPSKWRLWRHTNLLPCL